MSRMHPNARRATALTLLTSLILVLAAASAVALHPTPANAGSSAIASPAVSSRVPMPGDPNTPDEGRGGGASVTSPTSSTTSPARSFFDWVKGIAHNLHLPLR